MTVKRIFAAVLSAVMAFGTVGSLALAKEAEPVVVLPNGEVVTERPTIDAPVMPMEAGEEITVSSTQELLNVINSGQIYGNNTITITNDLDLSPLFTNVAQYTGLIRFFFGTLKGDKGNGVAPVISGIPKNRALIYYSVGGTISNITFDVKDQAPYISFLVARLSASDPNKYSLNMDNVDIISSTNSNVAVDSNYSPYVYTTPDGGFNMNNCDVNLNMTGAAYSSIFYGYYPAYGGDISFTNCTYKGQFTNNRAGMFFGNSTGLDNYVANTVSIKGCQNLGDIRGRDSAHYLCAAAAQDGEYGTGTDSAAIENILENGRPEGDEQYPNFEKIEGGGSLINGFQELPGFGAEWNTDQTITIKQPTDSSNVSYYRVRVGAYIGYWNISVNPFLYTGTYLYTIDRKIDKPADDQPEISGQLMAYGLADSGYGNTLPVEFLGNQLTQGEDGAIYYIIDPDVVNEPDYKYHVGSQYSVLGATPADVVIVSAYDAENKLLDTVWLRGVTNDENN